VCVFVCVCVYIYIYVFRYRYIYIYIQEIDTGDCSPVDALFADTCTFPKIGELVFCVFRSSKLFHWSVRGM